MSYLPGTPEPATTSKPEVIALPHSKFLQAASYDPAQFALTLDFKNGSQAMHRFVYPVTFQQFKEAPSHGSYYARNIKGKYPTIFIRSSMKPSDLTKAKKEFRYAPKSHK